MDSAPAYSAAAIFGRVYSAVGAVVGVIVALILIIAGVSQIADSRLRGLRASSAAAVAARASGWRLIGSGVLFGGIGAGIAAMAYKSKGFAAGYGAVEGVRMVGRALFF